MDNYHGDESQPQSVNTLMSTRNFVFALLACCIACGVYWNVRANQTAAAARVLEERARAIKMEAEIERLRTELETRENLARSRTL